MIASILIWLSVIIAGFGIMIFSSKKIVHHVSMLAYGLAIPPFILGITLVSVGTDLPEIANSIMASLAGEGDLNVGDSAGSVLTQITLALGLMPFFAGAFDVKRGQVLWIGFLTVAALGLGSFLFADGYFSRLDGIVLFFCWVVFSLIAVKYSTPQSEPFLQTTEKRKAFNAFVSIFYLLILLAGAAAAVKGITELAEMANIPKYIISFFGASIGTSLPELVVDIIAIRKGEKGLAIGGILGACLVDATLSLSAGPLIAPTIITAALAVKGSIVTMVIVALATGVIALRQKHDYRTGLFLLLLYASAYYFLLT